MVFHCHIITNTNDNSGINSNTRYTRIHQYHAIEFGTAWKEWYNTHVHVYIYVYKMENPNLVVYSMCICSKMKLICIVCISRAFYFNFYFSNSFFFLFIILFAQVRSGFLHPLIRFLFPHLSCCCLFIPYISFAIHSLAQAAFEAGSTKWENGRHCITLSCQKLVFSETKLVITDFVWDTYVFIVCYAYVFNPLTKIFWIDNKLSVIVTNVCTRIFYCLVLYCELQ